MGGGDQVGSPGVGGHRDRTLAEVDPSALRGGALRDEFAVVAAEPAVVQVARHGCGGAAGEPADGLEGQLQAGGVGELFCQVGGETVGGHHTESG
ncbi:hypothetical protein, partial [Frankia sp. Cr1]|uniref:hypothetical protein n=1 Tax=Frankia sp. Cr1 TaxID=3073931 RepID=UPI003A0FED87